MRRTIPARVPMRQPYSFTVALHTLALVAMLFCAATTAEGGGSPEDLKAVEITTWNWKKDPSWGSNGVIHWVVQIKNKSARNVSRVDVEFSTFDAKGKIVSSSHEFVHAIPPGGSRAEESFADLYGSEADAHIQVVS